MGGQNWNRHRQAASTTTGPQQQRQQRPRDKGYWHWQSTVDIADTPARDNATSLPASSLSRRDRSRHAQQARKADLQERIAVLSEAMVARNPTIPRTSTVNSPTTTTTPSTNDNPDITRRREAAVKIKSLKQSLALYPEGHPLHASMVAELNTQIALARSALPLGEQIENAIAEVAIYQQKVDRLTIHAQQAQKQLDGAKSDLEAGKDVLNNLRVPPPTPPVSPIQSAWSRTTSMAATLDALRANAQLMENGRVNVDASAMGALASLVEALGADLLPQVQPASVPGKAPAYFNMAASAPASPTSPTAQHVQPPPCNQTAPATPVGTTPVPSDDEEMAATTDPYTQTAHSDGELQRSPNGDRATRTPRRQQTARRMVGKGPWNKGGANIGSMASLGLQLLPSQASVTSSSAPQSSAWTPIVGNNSRTNFQDTIIAETAGKK